MRQNKEEKIISLVEEYFGGNIRDAIALFLEHEGGSHIYKAEYESKEKNRTQELEIEVWESTSDYGDDYIGLFSRQKGSEYNNYTVERIYQKATFGPRKILIGDVLNFNDRLLKKHLSNNEGNMEVWKEALRRKQKLNNALGEYIEKYAQKKRSLLYAPMGSLVHHEVKKISKDLATIIDAYGVVDYETYQNLTELYTLRQKYDDKLPENKQVKAKRYE